MTFSFPGVSLRHTAGLLILQSERPLTCLSSAVVGGGLLAASTIINAHVDKDYDLVDPVGDLQNRAAAAGIMRPFVGLMTAVFLHEAQISTLGQDGVTVTAVVTAGVSNASAAGISPPAVYHAGTINLILLIDGALPPSALVNAVITATEAKSDTLVACGVQTPNGERATGTSSDAIVVACTGRAPTIPYTGPATTAGWLIGRTVRQALRRALA